MTSRKPKPSKKKSGPPGRKPSHRIPSQRQRSEVAKKSRAGVKKSTPKPAETDADGRQRLQKVLAAAGLGSRRACEELITEGRVEVDHEVVTELGTRVDPHSQQIRVDGQTLNQPRLTYLAVNKPKGVLCTNRDPMGRTRVIDMVPERYGRLFTVGRLDQNSEGLILLTNDGELANRLTHPSYGVQKIYRVQCAGTVTREVLDQLSRGVYLAEGLSRVTDAKIKTRYKMSTILEMVLEEGKNREIRRLLARQGHKVMQLARVAVGPVKIGNLPPGEFRQLTKQEIAALKKQVGLK